MRGARAIPAAGGPMEAYQRAIGDLLPLLQPTAGAQGHAHSVSDLVDANLQPAARLGVENDLLVLRAGPDDLHMEATRSSYWLPALSRGPPASSSPLPSSCAQPTSLRAERAGLLAAADAAEAERIPCEQRVAGQLRRAARRGAVGERSEESRHTPPAGRGASTLIEVSI